MNSSQAMQITNRTIEYRDHLIEFLHEKEGDRYCREHLLEEIASLTNSADYFREQEHAIALSRPQYYDDFLHSLRWYILKSRTNQSDLFEYSAEATRLMQIFERINRKPAVRIESLSPFRWVITDYRAYQVAFLINQRPADRLSRLSPETVYPWLRVLRTHNVPTYKNVHLDRWLKNKTAEELANAEYKGLGVMLVEEALAFWYQIQERLQRETLEISGTISENPEAFRELVKYTELHVWNTPELAMLTTEQLQEYDEFYLDFFTSL